MKSTGPYDLYSRFAHPHYLLNGALALPLPVLFVLNFPFAKATALDVKTLTLLALIPSSIFTIALSRPANNAEFLYESLCGQCKLVNAFGLFWARELLSLSVTKALLYLVVWFLVSFFYPQPNYLGPHNVIIANQDVFESEILFYPPALAPKMLNQENSEPHLTEHTSKPSSRSELSSVYELKRTKSTSYHVVLFHADWSSKSRDLQITLSRLSLLYSCHTTKFWIVDSEMAPDVFSDFHLSIAPSTTDIPVIMLFHKGMVVARLPQGVEYFEKERVAKKLERYRTARKGEGRAKIRRKIQAGASSSHQVGSARKISIKESDSETQSDASDNERENEQKSLMARYQWDRTPHSIVAAFNLEKINNPDVTR